MKERPIPFTAPMVQALLKARKTQTRRLLKPQPINSEIPGSWQWAPPLKHLRKLLLNEGALIEFRNPGSLILDCCPHGKPGDKLWVREAWQAWKEFNHLPPRDIPSHALERINYLADGNKWDARYRHARFMPRWASRILLEITDVRVERLQDISVNDAVAEGALNQSVVDQFAQVHAVDMYRCIWNGINGPGSWNANPWVWVIEFRRVGS